MTCPRSRGVNFRAPWDLSLPFPLAPSLPATLQRGVARSSTRPHAQEVSATPLQNE